MEKYLSVRGQGSQLEKQREEKEQIADKLGEFEHYLSQTNLLIEIGRKITSSLNVKEILIIVKEFVQSSMDIEEIELLYIQNEKTIAKIVTSYKVKETGRNLSIDFALKRESLSDTLTKCQLYYEEIEEYERCAKLFDLKKRMEQDLVD